MGPEPAAPAASGRISSLRSMAARNIRRVVIDSLLRGWIWTLRSFSKVVTQPPPQLQPGAHQPALDSHLADPQGLGRLLGGHTFYVSQYKHQAQWRLQFFQCFDQDSP